MARRRRLSRRVSRKHFRKHAHVNYRNVHGHPMRGGIRF